MEHLPPPRELELEGNVAQNWTEWLEEFEVYLRAVDGTNKSSDVQLATFLHLIGRQARKVASTFTYTASEEYNVGNLKLKFNEYCLPRKQEMFSRFKLEHTHRKEGESADQFLTRLKIVAKDCAYEGQENKILRDRIVFDLKDEKLRERILERENVTLDKAMEIIRAAEVSRAQSQSIKDSLEGGAEINQVQKKDKNTNKNWTQKSEEKQVCRKCGRTHEYRNCPAFGKACLRCGKQNHFAVQCKSREEVTGKYEGNTGYKKYKYKPKYKAKNVHEVEETDSDDSTGLYLNELQVGPVQVGDIGSAWYETLQVGIQHLKCKLDSGAQANVLPYKLYKRLQDKPKLRPTSVTLVAYGGKKIESLGITTLNVKIREHPEKVTFVVVNVSGHPVLGLDTCAKLKLLEKGNGKPKVQISQVSQESVISEEEIKKEFKEVFSGIGCYQGEIHLETRPEVEPVVHPARKIPVTLQAKLKSTLDDLETKGIINRVTYPTNWVNSLILVEKSDGELRLCLDPRDLNSALKREHYHMPTGEEIFLKLKGMTHFTVIDMKWGFWNVKLDSESADLCVFNTPYGRYRFNRLPFGISVAPEIFQRINDQVYGDIPGVGISTDDFIIGGTSEIDCYERVKTVLRRAKKQNNKFNSKKIQLCKTQVRYIGKLVSKEGFEMDPDKVKAIMDMRPPSNKNELRTFLGMSTYLMPFVGKLADLTAPLRELLKEQNEFQWDENLTRSFERMKTAIANGAKLVHFDPNKPIVIQSDASQYGLGGCLMQEGAPVAYTSRALTEVESRYAQIEKEFLAVVYSCEKFHYYIYGSKIQVHTDHKPLIAIVKKKFDKITPRLQRFVLRLQRYSVELVYKPGKELKVADALSRNFDNKNLDLAYSDRTEIEGEVHDLARAHSGISEAWEFQIKEAMEDDLESIAVKKLVECGWPEHKSKVETVAQKLWDNRFNIHFYKGLILNGNKILIPSKLRRDIVNKLHESHQGIEKTKSRARQVVYWPGINKDIEEVVSQCAICQEHRKDNMKEPLLPHRVPDLPWSTVGMDIFETNQETYLIITPNTQK